MSTTRSEVLDPRGNDQATGYVLPKPGRGGNELVLPAGPSALQRHREAEVAKAIGSRVSALAECQQQFLSELRSCLEDVEDTVAEAGRARLRTQVRSALSVLEWCDAVQADLKGEAEWAGQGLQPIELIGFCADVAGRWSTGATPVHVGGACNRPWWGDAGLLAETLEAALAVVADRSRGAGSIAIEVEVGGSVANVRVAGSGEPSDEVDPALVRVFRQNVERLGAAVAPDSLGPGGTGIVLVLPRVDADG